MKRTDEGTMAEVNDTCDTRKHSAFKTESPRGIYICNWAAADAASRIAGTIIEDFLQPYPQTSFLRASTVVFGDMLPGKALNQVRDCLVPLL